MNLLDGINSTEDVKKLNIKQLETLAAEIRGFLIDNVSKHGGHLSSNLGTVELTLALHKVFDVSSDRIVWDVGHQSYTHKILTGRRGAFATLRTKGGLSGFPKTAESETDAFNTGHSSTSVSAALGFAKAFELRGEKHFAVAVIGDGALTGGEAYEALNHAGSGSTPLIVVLNDNGMSISPNVGGLAQYLEKLSSTAEYIGTKGRVNKFLKELPFFGEPFRKCVRLGKRIIKKILLQKKLFENMGLEYLGPVNGHDLSDLIAVLEYAKSKEKPVVVHVRTQKGRGYVPAEKNPTGFHGVGGFDPDTGEMNECGGETYSEVFGREAVRLAEENEKIICITAAMPAPTGLGEFSRRFPNRFFDVGIAEQHAVTFASALARAGFVPVFAVYSTFLQRAYDQLLHDTALCGLHVVFAVDRAGAVGSDGETHQGIYDLSYLSHIPNMVIMAPSCSYELEEMLRFAAEECTSPVAVRYPRGAADTNTYGGEIRFGRGVCLREGSDVLIVAAGSEVREAMLAADLLGARGISAGVMNARFVKPFDRELFGEMSEGCRLVASAEDNVRIGGLAAAVREVWNGGLISFGFDDAPLEQATVAEQKAAAALDGCGMADRIAERLAALDGGTKGQGD